MTPSHPTAPELFLYLSRYHPDFLTGKVRWKIQGTINFIVVESRHNGVLTRSCHRLRDDERGYEVVEFDTLARGDRDDLIQQLWSTGLWTQQEIAVIFDVSQSLVSNVIKTII